LAEDETGGNKMEVRNCRKCGKIFNYVAGAPICSACRELIEKKFEEVRNYIRENHGADIPEICRDCQVEKSQIHQWIREERLVFDDNSSVSINCEKCGAHIKTGRFCEKCKKEMTDNLNNAIGRPHAADPVSRNKKASQDRAKMRFLDH